MVANDINEIELDENGNIPDLPSMNFWQVPLDKIKEEKEKIEEDIDSAPYEPKDEEETIILLKRQGIDDMDPVAVWEDGAWTDVSDDAPHVIGDGHYEDVPEEVLFNDFDGPDYFATTAEAYEQS